MARTPPGPPFTSHVRMMVSPWFRFFLDTIPFQHCKDLCPVLALNGEQDLQVREADLAPIRIKPCKTAATRIFKLPNYPACVSLWNHLLPTLPTGSPTEYGGISGNHGPGGSDAPVSMELKHKVPLKRERTARSRLRSAPAHQIDLCNAHSPHPMELIQQFVWRVLWMSGDRKQTCPTCRREISSRSPHSRRTRPRQCSSRSSKRLRHILSSPLLNISESTMGVHLGLHYSRTADT